MKNKNNINPALEKEIEFDKLKIKEEKKKKEEVKRSNSILNNLQKKFNNPNFISRFNTWEEFIENIKDDLMELKKLNIKMKESIDHKITIHIKLYKIEWLKYLEKSTIIDSKIGENLNWTESMMLEFGIQFNGKIKHQNVDYYNAYKDSLYYPKDLLETNLFTSKERKTYVKDLFDFLGNNTDIWELLNYNSFKNFQLIRKLKENYEVEITQIRDSRIELFDSMQDIIRKSKLTETEKNYLIKKINKLNLKYMTSDKSEEESIKHYFLILMKFNKIPSLHMLSDDNHSKSSWHNKLKNPIILSKLINENKKKLNIKNLKKSTRELLIENKIYLANLVKKIKIPNDLTNNLIKNKETEEDYLNDLGFKSSDL